MVISEINNYSIEWIDENGETLGVTPSTERIIWNCYIIS